MKRACIVLNLVLEKSKLMLSSEEFVMLLKVLWLQISLLVVCVNLLLTSVNAFLPFRYSPFIIIIIIIISITTRHLLMMHK